MTIDAAVTFEDATLATADYIASGDYGTNTASWERGKFRQWFFEFRILWKKFSFMEVIFSHPLVLKIFYVASFFLEKYEVCSVVYVDNPPAISARIQGAKSGQHLSMPSHRNGKECILSHISFILGGGGWEGRENAWQ